MANTKRLLLVDDDPFTIKMLEDLFRHDWKISNETVKERITERYAQDPPSLILLNAALRRTDGEPTFDAIHQTMPTTPIIVYSPANMVKVGRELVKKGAFWNLIAPINTNDLEHAMQIALEVEKHREVAQSTRRDFVNLEEGIARISLPMQSSLPEEFTFEQDELTQGIIDLLADALQVERVSLMLLDHKTGELRIKAAKGLHPTVIRNTVKHIGEGIAGSVARDGKPLFIRDVGSEQNYTESPYYDQFSTKSLICVPLKIGEHVVGILNANNKRSGAPFEQHELYLTTIFSHILLMTLQNAQAHFDRERLLLREAQFGQLYRKISGLTDLGDLFHCVLTDCCHIFQADGGVFFLLNEKETSLNAYSFSGNQFTGTEIPPQIFKHWQNSRNEAFVVSGADCKQNRLLPGVVKDAESWISVPVQLQNKRIGSLELGSTTPRRFLASDEQPLTLIAQQTSMGISNIRLYDKLLISIKEISDAKKEVDRMRRHQFL